MNRWAFLLITGALAGAMIWWGQQVTAQPATTNQPDAIPSPITSGCQTRPVQLQFWTLQLDTFADYFHRLIAEYEGQHPNVCVHWVDVPFSEGEKRALTAVLSDDVPDIINLNPAFSATLQEKGALLDLNEWIPRMTLFRGFAPVTLAAATSWDGHLFAVPWYLTSQVLFFNQSLLAAAKLTEPPATEADLLRLARTLRQKKLGYVLMPPLSENGYFLRDIMSQGVTLYDRQGRAVFADNPAAVARLTFWQNAYREGLIPPDSLTETHLGALERYQAGTLALLPAGASLVPQIETNAPQVFRHTGVRAQPTARERYVDFAMMVLAVPTRSRHPREAVDFALFVANSRNQMALSQLAPVLPSAFDALCVMRTQAVPMDLLSRAQHYSLSQIFNSRIPFPQRAHQSERNRLIDAAVQSALLGRQSPAAALKQAQDAKNAL